jgi:hypothetical protein
MGGYVSLVASETVDAKAVFLMAPALYMPGYGAARKAVMPTSMHCHERYANNRAELA